jgi:quercetin dioxygenase-like cupin family protein
MAFPIYDYRVDTHLSLVTPQIRSRFVKVEPGPMPEVHSHDLGQEVFLVLEGDAEFEIQGERQVVGPGQMCVALTDQTHAVRAVGPEPAIMYLSVTPHIQPTHTFWDDQGHRRPHHFFGPEAFNTKIDASVSDGEVVDRYVEALGAVVNAGQTASVAHRDLAGRLKVAIAEGNAADIEGARNALWDSVSGLYELVAELSDVWNDVAARSVEASRRGG